MQIKNRINWSIVGILCFSLFLTSCSEEQTIIQRCNNFDKSDTEFFQNSELKIGRKLILETTEEFGEINSNIPPKFMGSRLFLITDKNVILSYDLSRKGIIKPASVTSLPNIYEVVSDFIVENDSIVSFCSNLGIYSISEYNRHSKKVKLFHTDTTMCHSMPFLGLSLRKFDDKFLFPQVPVVSANNEGNFLSIYNKNKRHEYAIGNLLPRGETRFAPFFDAFLMSEITNNIFYVSSTSSNGVAKCRLKWENNKWTIEYLETLSFSKQLFNHFQGRMKESDLGDFAAMELAAISHPYGLGVHDCGNRLIRITKKEQPFMNKKTSTKNIMMNAPWTMEILNLKSKKGEIHEIAAGQFRFTNAFVHKNQLFVLSNQSNQHEIIYYSLR